MAPRVANYPRIEAPVTTHRHLATERLLLNKVPQVTLYFWIGKVLCTTVGETAADFLNVSLNLGLTGVSVVTTPSAPDGARRSTGR